MSYAITGHISVLAVNMLSDGVYLIALTTCVLLYGAWALWLCAMTPVSKTAKEQPGDQAAQKPNFWRARLRLGESFLIKLTRFAC
jgi:hypothetical protein